MRISDWGSDGCSSDLYPHRRYYGGCEFVDVVEELAIARAKQLFDCEFVNVQPHSGAQANQCVSLALLQPGDTILGMALSAGGHLTHGAKPNLSGKWFNAVQYGVRRDDGRIDFDEVEKLEIGRAHVCTHVTNATPGCS